VSRVDVYFYLYFLIYFFFLRVEKNGMIMWHSKSVSVVHPTYLFTFFLDPESYHSQQMRNEVPANRIL